MKKKIIFLNKIKNIKSISDFLLKINHFVNLLLTFPKGGFARYTVDLFMKNISSKFPSKIKVLDVGAGNKPYENLFTDCTYESCEHETIHKETNVSNDDHTFSYPNGDFLEEYFNQDGTHDPLCGRFFHGYDAPTDPKGRTGWWKFQLKVIDRCNSNAVVSKSDVLLVDW